MVHRYDMNTDLQVLRVPPSPLMFISVNIRNATECESPWDDNIIPHLECFLCTFWLADCHDLWACHGDVVFEMCCWGMHLNNCCWVLWECLSNSLGAHHVGAGWNTNENLTTWNREWFIQIYGFSPNVMGELYSCLPVSDLIPCLYISAYLNSSSIGMLSDYCFFPCHPCHPQPNSQTIYRLQKAVSPQWPKSSSDYEHTLAPPSRLHVVEIVSLQTVESSTNISQVHQQVHVFYSQKGCGRWG